MSSGSILDTVVFYITKLLGTLPAIIQAPVMFWAHTVINFFVTSGSGQANVTMPIFLPVADLIGMSKETAILALNYGDGLSNYIYPHSSSLMAFLAACASLRNLDEIHGQSICRMVHFRFSVYDAGGCCGILLIKKSALLYFHRVGTGNPA